MATLGLDDEPTWYIDSTASSHLTDVVPQPSRTTITTAGGHRLPVVGKGKVVFTG